MEQFMSLCVVVLTKNEQRHLARCLESVKGVADRVVVVDSGSEDGTSDIARRFGADVYHNSWVNYATQFQWGLEHAGIEEEWIFRLDADEYLDVSLQLELHTLLREAPAGLSGYLVNRKLIFMGRMIRWGGRQPQMNLRIWRRGIGRIEDRWMDEHVVLATGVVGQAPGAIVDENLNDIAWWTEKHNRYAAREMIDILNAETGFLEDGVGSGGGVSGTAGKQADLTRARKQGLYQRLPLFLRPAMYFLYRYIFQMGFLDGKEGLIYHVLQGFWYRFLVDVKLLEARRMISECQNYNDMREILGRAFNLELNSGGACIGGSSSEEFG